MSVTLCKEIHDGREGGEDASKHGSVRRYSRIFWLTTDSRYDAAGVVLSYATLPKIGSLYPYDSYAWCRQRRAVQLGFSPYQWHAICNYSSQFEATENPLGDPAEIEWGTEAYQRAFYTDTAGNQILNSAGSYYDPPVMGDDDRWVVSVKKNVPFVPNWILGYRTAINSAGFTIDGISVPAKCGKLSQIRISPWQIRNDVRFRVFSYGLQFTDGVETWEKKLLDQGYYEIDPTAATKRREILIQGRRPSSPWPLDGSGAAVVNPSPTTAVTRTHAIYKEKDFTVLPMV